MKSPLDELANRLGCICYPSLSPVMEDEHGGCVCTDREQVLRAYQNEITKLPPMTLEQREWCLDEIGRGTEYGYSREEYVNASDKDMASAVLQVWTEYCRDKGLL